MEDTFEMNNTNVQGGKVALSNSLYIVSGVLCVILNTIVLVIIRQQNTLQDQMGVLYKIMGASNMVFGISWSAWHFLWFTVESREACELIGLAFPFIYQVSNTMAMASLCGISLNLYLLVTRPLRYYTLVTRKRFELTVAFTIAVIILSCCIYLPIPDSAFMNLLTDRCFNKDLSAKSNWPSVVHTFYQIFPACATFAFTSVINVKLLVIVRQKTKAVANLATTLRKADIIHPDIKMLHARDQFDPKAENARARQLGGILGGIRPKWRLKGYLTVILMSIAFSALWTPHIIYYAFDIDKYYVVILDKFSVSNTWVQPILYVVTHSEARRLCWKFLRCKHYCQKRVSLG